MSKPFTKEELKHLKWRLIHQKGLTVKEAEKELDEMIRVVIENKKKDK